MNNTTDLIQKINPLFENTDLKDIFNEQAIAVMKTILILFITKIHKANKGISIDYLFNDLLNVNLDQHGGITPPNKKKKPISILHTFKVIVLTLTLFSFLFIIYSYFVKLEETLYTDYNPPYYTEYEPPSNWTEYKQPYYPYKDTEFKTENLNTENLNTENLNTENLNTENSKTKSKPKNSLQIVNPLIENISLKENEIAYIVSQAKNLYEKNNNLNIQKPFDETVLKMIEGISENIHKNILIFEGSTKSIIENAVTNISNISFAIVIRKLFSIEGKQLIISKVLTEKMNNNIDKYLTIANIQLEDIKNDFRMELEHFIDLIKRLNHPSLVDRAINSLQIGLLSYLTNPASTFKNKFNFEFGNIVNKLKKINNIQLTMGLGLEELKSDAKLELDRSMNELFNHINSIYYLFVTTFTILSALIYELTPSNEGQNVIINVQMPNGNMPNGNEYNGEEYEDEDEYENKNDNQKRILYKPTGADVEDVEDEPIYPVHVTPSKTVTRSKTRSKTPKQITYKKKGGKSKKSRKNKKKS
jgi:hypothetical protein